MATPTEVRSLSAAASMAVTDVLLGQVSGRTLKITPDVLPFLQSGSGGITRTMQDIGRSIVRSGDYDTNANYNTGLAALTETIGVAKFDAGTSAVLRNTASDLGGVSEPATTAPVYVLAPDGAGGVIVDVAKTTSAGPGLVFRRARGTSASPADVADGDQIGWVDFRAYSGTKFWQMVSIDADVDGTFTSGQRPPSRLMFHTNIANVNSTERMRINGKGEVFINTTAQVSGITDAKLTVKQTNGTADWTAMIVASTTSAGSYGLRVNAGTEATDYCQYWSTVDGATVLMTLNGAGTLTLPFKLAVSGVGPHVISGTADGNSILTIAGNMPAALQALRITATLNPAAGQSVEGIYFSPTIVEAASGSHAIFSSLTIAPPTITAGGGSITDAATVRITAAPTEAVNANYALWVDAGNVRIDSLAGTGSRTVVADANGVLSAP